MRNECLELERPAGEPVCLLRGGELDGNDSVSNPLLMSVISSPQLANGNSESRGTRHRVHPFSDFRALKNH